MVASGVFIEIAEGRYYMDEDAARWLVKRRWQVMLIFLAVVTPLFAVLQMFL